MPRSCFSPARGTIISTGPFDRGHRGGMYRRYHPSRFTERRKLPCKCLTLESSELFDLPIWITLWRNRWSGTIWASADQGIFAFWINAYLRGAALKYIGFGGTGFQTRDCFHPRDLARLVAQQIDAGSSPKPRIINLGRWRDEFYFFAPAQRMVWRAGSGGVNGGGSNSSSFRSSLGRDGSQSACTHWGWRPAYRLESILEEIATTRSEPSLAGDLWPSDAAPPAGSPDPLRFLVGRPARARRRGLYCPSTIEHLHLRGSGCSISLMKSSCVRMTGRTDSTWNCSGASFHARIVAPEPQNPAPHGFGRAIIWGLNVR